MNHSGVKVLHTMQDEQLMQQLQAGREDAFNLIVKRYQTRLYNFLFRYTRNHEDTEDLVQETFFRVYRSRNSYEPIARFSTWLFTIAGNLMRTQYRKKSRMQTWSIDDDDQEYGSYYELPSTEVTPDEQTHTEMTVNLINEAFGSMAGEYSELLDLRENKEMSYEEIAEAVNLPMGTVKSRINRGRQKMQNMMRNLNDESLIYAA
jgi:RNA polymerase sigma factor (sigma-70 family)